jgi:hypothetical protein
MVRGGMAAAAAAAAVMGVYLAANEEFDWSREVWALDRSMCVLSERLTGMPAAAR